jgi:hypothetical protein
MSRSISLAGLAVAALVAYMIAEAASASVAGTLAVLAAAITAGELVMMRPYGRDQLPLSFAVFTVLVRAATPAQFILVVVVAEVVAAGLRPGALDLRDRASTLAERCSEAFSAGAAYEIVMTLGHQNETPGVVVLALTLAALAPIVVADLVGFVRDGTIAPLRARAADVAIITSGTLMAIGYAGIDGKGELGLLGPILFSIPLVAAWYSFELLASTRRSFEQTIQALAAAPELGGLVREGHADRVADLAVSMGRSLSLSPVELDHLWTAALLHHLGAVCVDEPEDGGSLDVQEVALAGATMLRASEALAAAGDVVAAEPVLHRPHGVGIHPTTALSGMILKVASAYDELTEGDDAHAAWAVEALYTGPGYVYDGRVLGALERVLERRGVVLSR